MRKTAPIALPTRNHTFWPADDLRSWQEAPRESFLDWLSQQRIVHDRQFRRSSTKTYVAIFSWWLDALEREGVGLLEASPKDAAKIFAAHELEAISRRRYLQLLDRVYRYLSRIGWPGVHPLREELAKEKILDPDDSESLDETELAAVVERLEALPGWRGKRDRAAAGLLLGAGLRANELIGLRVGDVSPLYEIEVRPNSVHRAHRTLVLPEGPWRTWIDEWQIERKASSIPGNVFCPATRQGSAFSVSGLFRRVNLWLGPLTETHEQTGANLLRNTFARLALTCGRYSLEEVQEFLGHEEQRATLRHVAALGKKARLAGTPVPEVLFLAPLK